MLLYISKLIDRISTHTHHTRARTQNSQLCARRVEDDKRGRGGKRDAGRGGRQRRRCRREGEVCNTGRFTLSRVRRRNSRLYARRRRRPEDLPGDDGRLTLISKPLCAERSEWSDENDGGGHGTTRGVTEHTKMADTLGSFVRPGDNLTLNPSSSFPNTQPPVAFRPRVHTHTHTRRSHCTPPPHLIVARSSRCI